MGSNSYFWVPNALDINLFSMIKYEETEAELVTPSVILTLYSGDSSLGTKADGETRMN